MTTPLFIIYYDLNIGGIQRKIVDIVNYLSLKNPNLPIYILLRRQKDEDSVLFDQIRNKKAKVIYYPDWLRWRIPFFFPVFVLCQVWKLKPRAILSFSDVPSFSSVFAKTVFFWKEVKVVISEDPNKMLSEQLKERDFAFLRQKLVKLLYPFADTVFTVSDLFRQDLIKIYSLPKDKVKFFPNWTSLSGRKLVRAKKRYDLVFVGRLVKAKRVSFLLEAVKQVKKRYPKISLCLVGDGEEFSALKKQAKKSGLMRNVFFVGKTGRIAHYLARSRVFVLPSATEGLPAAILEAMALGLPVISSNYPGARELIEENKTGFIFKNKEELVKKISFLIEWPEKGRPVVCRAKKMVERDYSLENINIYLDALGLI